MAGHFILNFTPTGMVPTRTMTPFVPLDPPEIISQVCAAAQLGVNMVHLHVRDPQTGEPAWQKELYAECIAGIRAGFPELLICVSTSGRNFPEFAQRSAVLELTGDLRPDFASLTLSSLNFVQQASLNHPKMIQDLVSKMLENGIRPELEAFDLGMVNYAHYLIQKQLVRAPYYFNLILGNIAGAQDDLLSAGLMLERLPAGAYWSLGGIGASQLRMNAVALAMGGGVRVGLEDNLWFDAERTQLADNLKLVERVLALASALGLTPYSPAAARRLLTEAQP